MIIPADPGEPDSVSKNIKDDVVGILSNGVLLDSHKQTWSYDSCNGHSDTKGQYHYHIPPSCLLKGMGVKFASSSSWWMNDDGTAVREYDDMASQFPATGSPSPVIGRAIDGYPIYALYDEDGNLQRSADFGGTVDECNGKLDSEGNYGYYITSDPPFAPSCLKGKNVGYFTYHKTDKKCPADGIKNNVLSKAAVDACTATTRSFLSLADCPTLGDMDEPGTGKDPIPDLSSSAANYSKTLSMVLVAGATVLSLYFQ